MRLRYREECRFIPYQRHDQPRPSTRAQDETVLVSGRISLPTPHSQHRSLIPSLSRDEASVFIRQMTLCPYRHCNRPRPSASSGRGWPYFRRQLAHTSPRACRRTSLRGLILSLSKDEASISRNGLRRQRTKPRRRRTKLRRRRTTLRSRTNDGLDGTTARVDLSPRTDRRPGSYPRARGWWTEAPLARRSAPRRGGCT
mgnify:CR=1 FL=1